MYRQLIPSIVFVLGFANISLAEEKVTASLVADASAIQPGKPFYIGLKFDIPKGFYTYYKSAGSIGKAPNIQIVAPPGFEVGPLEYPGPEVKYQEFGPNLNAHYIYKRTTVVVAKVTPPANLPAGDQIAFGASAAFQYCKESGQCVLVNEKSLELSIPTVASGATAPPSADAGLFTAAMRQMPSPGDHSKYARVWANLSTNELRPGETAELIVNVEVEDGYKLQMNRPAQPGLISTDLILNDVPGLGKFPVPKYPPAMLTKSAAPGTEKLEGYTGKFAIKVPVVAKNTLNGTEVVFSGLLRYQACTLDGTCYPPLFASFTLRAPVKPAIAATTVIDSATLTPPIASLPKSNAEAGVVTVAPSHAAGGDPVDAILSEMQPVDAVAEGVTGGFWQYMLYAFLGGLILNVMPCVLPVIAIKVLGFVQQAGASRGRILLLNLAYSAGVILVFLGLATLAVIAGISWGGLFQHAQFNIVMAGLVFSMGLSLLGVFEIPVPGFVGSAGGQHQEGPLGAFFTGVLATLLATPCSGPFLGVTLGWSVQQPPQVTYAVWGTMGLGMASPYILFGMFPQMVRWLPKPGVWMVTFKEFAGMALMVTVVYIIWILDETYTIPVLLMLTGLALGFWMIGSLYDFNSSPMRKNIVRGTATVVAGTIVLFSMTTFKEWVAERAEKRLDNLIAKRIELAQGDLSKLIKKRHGATELSWEPFSETKLRTLIREGKTVLIDFTADWCPTCKANEALALNTAETRAIVDELDAVTLYADWTNVEPEIKAWLKRFKSESIPLTVIFPGSRPRQPIVLREVYSKAKLISSLRSAGPSTEIGKRVAVSTK